MKCGIISQLRPWNVLIQFSWLFIAETAKISFQTPVDTLCLPIRLGVERCASHRVVPMVENNSFHKLLKNVLSQTMIDFKTHAYLPVSQ